MIIASVGHLILAHGRLSNMCKVLHKHTLDSGFPHYLHIYYMAFKPQNTLHNTHFHLYSLISVIETEVPIGSRICPKS